MHPKAAIADDDDLPRTALNERVPAQRVVVFLLGAAHALDAVAPAETLALAVRQNGEPAYCVDLVSPRGGAVRTTSGIELVTRPSAATPPEDIDTFILVAAAMHTTTIEARSWLKQSIVAARRVVALGHGAFLLAELGLLNGRRVTMHWSARQELAKRYPSVTADADVIFVRDGPIYSCAGASAGIDVALALVEEDLGSEAVQRVARQLVLFTIRPGGQAQFSTEIGTRLAGHAAIRELQAWMTSNLQDDLSVGALARRVAMSPRNFARVFLAETGTTPAAYADSLRLEVARMALERTDEPLKVVAHRSGFGSVESLRRSFNRHLGVPPGTYRAAHREAAFRQQRASAAIKCTAHA